MAERKPRATREEALHAKIAKNEEAKARIQEKIDSLDAIINDLKQQLKDLKDEKKAERAAEAKAKREKDNKALKELMKAIKASGLSMDEVRAKLGI